MEHAPPRVRKLSYRYVSYQPGAGIPVSNGAACYAMLYTTAVTLLMLLYVQMYRSSIPCRISFYPRLRKQHGVICTYVYTHWNYYCLGLLERRKKETSSRISRPIRRQTIFSSSSTTSLIPCPLSKRQREPRQNTVLYAHKLSYVSHPAPTSCLSIIGRLVAAVYHTT